MESIIFLELWMGILEGMRPIYNIPGIMDGTTMEKAAINNTRDIIAGGPSIIQGILWMGDPFIIFLELLMAAINNAREIIDGSPIYNGLLYIGQASIISDLL
jgi:hypothetical protein